MRNGIRIVTLSAVLATGWACTSSSGQGAQSTGPAPKFSTPFQAVLLASGQVYYAKVEGLGTPFPTLRDVYYIQTATSTDTKQVTNVLIRRGKEWHGPDYTVVNAEHIVLIEPVTPGSKVAELIAEQEKQAKK
jgi:hypothetical protein